MKRHIIAISFVILVGTTEAISQAHGHPEPNGGSGGAQRNIRLPSPAERARIEEARRLGDAARTALSAGDYLEAETDARQAVADGERSGFSDETLASSLYSQGREQEAFQAYKKIADAGGDFPAA